MSLSALLTLFLVSADSWLSFDCLIFIAATLFEMWYVAEI